MKLHDLLSIQKSMEIPKMRYNKFGDFYYRSVEDIYKAAKKKLPEGSQLLLEDNIVEIGGRLFVKATAYLAIPGDPPATFHAIGWAELDDTPKKKMDKAQMTGAASSYARKRALEALFLLDDGQDNDVAPPNNEQPQPPVFVKWEGETIKTLDDFKAVLDKIEFHGEIVDLVELIKTRSDIYDWVQEAREIAFKKYKEIKKDKKNE